MYGDLVSVIIPTYNRKNTIKRAIDSVLKQTYKNIELIIVDDCSTDGTMEFVESEFGDIDNMIYIVNAVNLGNGGSRNVGVSYARGEYIAFQDSDDEWMPEKLDLQMKKMDDETGLVYCSYRYEMCDGNHLIYPSSELPLVNLSDEIWPFILCYPLISTQTMLIKKELFARLGGFNESLKANVDYEFSVRFAYHYKISYVDMPLVLVYETPGSVQSKKMEKVLTQFVIMDEFYGELQAYGLIDFKISQVHKRAKEFGCEKEFLHLLAQMEQEEYRQYAAGIEA